MFGKCVSLLVSLALFVLVLGPAHDVQAANVNWTGAGADDLWSTPENWSTGAPPTGADRFRMISAPGGPTIINEGAIANDGWIGAPLEGDENAYLTVDGGTLTTNSFIVVGRRTGDNGTLNMISGAITAGANLYVGHTGLGTVNITGGTITAPGVVIGLNATAVGRLNLHGGVINANNLQMVSNPNAVKTLDVGAGTLILNGNDLGAVQGYIDNGLVTAYEGQGTLNLDYDEAANQTTLTGLHKFKPYPADRGAVGPGAVELSWTLPEEVLKVDVYFTDDLEELQMFTDPASMQVVSQQNLTSVVVQTQPKTRYYWAVDTYTGDPNDPAFGHIFSFLADNLPPTVNAGSDAVTWLIDGAMTKNLDATVTDTDPTTVQWTVLSEPDDPNSPDAVIADPAAEDTSVTLSAAGEYVLQLEASDGEYAGTDTITINVYNDGCEAAQSLPDYVPSPGDLNGDCVVDELDLAILEADWLKDTSLIEP